MRWFKACAFGCGLLGWLTAVGQDSELFQPAFDTPAVAGFQLILLGTSQIQLPPVSPQELTTAARQPLSSTGVMHASASAGALVAVSSLSIPQLTPFIQREIPGLWRIITPPGQRLQTRQLPLRMYWENAADGGPGEPSIQPILRPWVQSQRTDELGRQIVEGGVLMEIPVELLSGSGQFRGRIQMTMEMF
ncbi:MAG: hypothetical protein Tsb002_09680 [Wenzhouxiangellaceae bacterium]